MNQPTSVPLNILLLVIHCCAMSYHEKYTTDYYHYFTFSIWLDAFVFHSLLYIAHPILPAIAMYIKSNQDDIDSMMYALNVFLIIRVVADVCLLGLLMFDLNTAYNNANLVLKTIAVMAAADFASARVRIYFSASVSCVLGFITYV